MISMHLTEKQSGASGLAATVVKLSKRFGVFTGLLVCASAAIAGRLDYERNFEGSLQLNCSGNCPTVSNEVAREKSRSMRSRLVKNSSGNSYRAEVVIPGRAKNLEYDRDYWYGFSTFLPWDWEVSYKNELIAQFHAALDPGDIKRGPPVAIRSGRNGDWEILSRNEGDRRGTYNEWTLNSVWEDVGKWTDWVIHYKPSIGAKGVLRVWKDGSLVVEHYGANAYNDQRGPFFKMGLYKPDWKNSDNTGRSVKTIYHDALRIASGPSADYFDVSPENGATPVVAKPREPQPQASPAPSTTPLYPLLNLGGGATPEPVINPIEEIFGGSDAASGNSGATFVEIANLSSGQYVPETFKVLVNAKDSDGIRKITLRVDDSVTNELIGTKTEPPWEFDVNTAAFNSGNRLRIKAVMHDKKGRRIDDVVRVESEKGSSQSGIQYAAYTPSPTPNAVADSPDDFTTVPALVRAPDIDPDMDPDEEFIMIANLAAKQSVSGVIKIVVDAYDPDGISKIVLRADDNVTSGRIGEKTAPPWEFSLDTADFRSGDRLRIKAVMHDESGGKIDHVVRVFTD